MTMTMNGTVRAAGVVASALLLMACGRHWRTPPALAARQTDLGDLTVRLRDARLDSVRAHVQQLARTEQSASITVGVARGSNVLWAEGFGWADRARRIQAGPNTSYSIASVTKAITSTAVMALHERGRLDIDAPIERYLAGVRLTGLAGSTERVTARRIMAHSAGLPLHFRAYFAPAAPPSADITLRRYGRVVFPPGSRFEYSNIGYRMLDVAIANASGQTYREYLRDHVFAPLGMTRSAVDPDPRWASEAATRYDRDGTALPPYRSDTPGSGDVWSSAYDLLRFGMFHLGMRTPTRPVLRDETLQLMHADASRTGTPWGLGWQIASERGHRVVSHGGGQPGVSAHLALFPDDSLVIVVLSNTSQVPVTDVAQRVARALLPPLPGAPTDGAGAQPALQPTASRLSGRWVGTVTTHEGTEPIALLVDSAGDTHARLGMEFTSALVRGVSQTAGGLSGTFAGTLNTEDVGGFRHTLALSVVSVGDELLGQLTAIGTTEIFGHSSFVRLKRLDDARLDEYVGTYRHDAADIRTISRDAGRLYSRRGSGRSYELDPLGEDLFALIGTGGSTLRFLRRDGRVIEVTWNDRLTAPRVP